MIDVIAAHSQSSCFRESMTSRQPQELGAPLISMALMLEVAAHPHESMRTGYRNIRNYAYIHDLIEGRVIIWDNRTAVRERIGQQSIREVLRPAHPLDSTGAVLDQGVDDLLGWRDNRWRRPLRMASIERMFDYARFEAAQQSERVAGDCPGRARHSPRCVGYQAPATSGQGVNRSRPSTAG